MAIAAHSYGTPIKNFFSGANTIDYDTDTFKVALVKAAYTPNVDTDDFWNDVSSNEIANGNGYTTGGITLSSLAVEIKGAENLVTWDAADVSWKAEGGALGEFQYSVVYKSTGTASTSPLILYVDWGEVVKITTGFEFSTKWATNGLLTAEYGA